MERPFPEPELSHPKKPRASRPKVKSGCHTCKSRRVKCDETKPNCLRCANFGRKCAGYTSKEGTPPKDAIPTTIRRLLSKVVPTEPIPEPPPSLDARFTLLSSSTPATHFIPAIPPEITFQDEAELQYLCHFRDVTAIELAGGFSPTLWNTVILQACGNAEIRQLTIATAAMSMAVSPLPGSHWNTASDFHRQYALLQYGDALKAIHRQIILSYVTPTMAHIQSALEIIVKKLSSEPHAYQIPSARSLSSQLITAPVNDELLLAFMRIDRPSLSLLCRQKGQSPRPAGRIFNLIFPAEPFEIPMIFSAIEEARTHLDDIRWRMFPCSQAPESMSKLWQNDKQKDLSPDIGAIPWHVQQWYQSYETPQDSAIISQRLALWHDTFSPLLNYAMTPAGETMFIPAAILHVQALAAELDNITLFPTVHAILDFSQRLVAHPKFSKGFVFDMGIISSLSLVVMLCPDRGLRREAVEVFKAMRPRREGVWDSRVCAEAGEKLIVEEEMGMEFIDPSLR
ncbi:hypothetical protein BGZ57DRAFT_772975 [Hyaloscypha finlandica]|nr:hypothetical protein BGZ57DRAFT_772975 [Hyaloscypha finlandica]